MKWRVLPYGRYAKKITGILSAGLLASAQSYTGEGVTETLRIALERPAHAEWARKMLELAGQVKLDIDLDTLREDRAFDTHGAVVR